MFQTRKEEEKIIRPSSLNYDNPTSLFIVVLKEKMSEISEIPWFQKIFGFKENLENIKKYITCYKKGENYLIHSSANNQTFNSGFFQIKDSNYFKNCNLKKKGNGKFYIISGNGKHSKRIELIDILKSEGQKEFNGATFQVASNFHCLDHMRGMKPPQHGISEYQLIGTQGPAATACCAPSLLYRNYFMNEVSIVKNLDLIDGVPYISQDRDFSNVSFGIGSHINCEVTMYGTNDGKLAFYSKKEKGKQIINHCLCAALDFSGPVKRTKITEQLGKKALDQQYKLTILSAWENSIKFNHLQGSNKCILTLLGCGVFENKIEDASDSIIKAKEIIKDSGLDVYLVCYSKDQFKKSYQSLKDLISETKGSIIEA